MNVMPFGKWKGTPLAEMPLSSLAWYVEQDWVDNPLLSNIADTIIGKVTHIRDEKDSIRNLDAKVKRFFEGDQ